MDRIEKSILSTSDLLEKSGYIKQIQAGLFTQMNLMKRMVINL
jgi:prolyl-tRNA synthetase